MSRAKGLFLVAGLSWETSGDGLTTWWRDRYGSLDFREWGILGDNIHRNGLTEQLCHVANPQAAH